MILNAPEQHADQNNAIPLTVIGGFLGAGKTTFLNHLLRQASCRYAVLVNDFGAVNVDVALIASHDGNTINLNNGCICCTMADGLGEALIRVLSAPVLPEHIVIEASGVGDPWQIAEVAMLEPDLQLAAVIVLADAEQLPAQLADSYIGDTVRRQLRRADLLMLNKIDLVDAARLQTAHETLAGLQPGLRVIETRDAKPPAMLMQFDHATTPERLPLFAPEDTPDHGIQRWLYRRNIRFEREKLERLLDSLPASLLRLKGWCWIEGENAPFLLQMTGSRWSLGATEKSSHPLLTSLLGEDSLLIGLGTARLPEDAVLTALFESAFAKTSLEMPVA
ncbi:GTP-binding protein [Ferrovibrio sp.]|uniref:CobW family GTP-binding protein n=1 Tax=Ferrovibrio sp. TaxID=1917215 RepID=UPI0025C56276|nr:GTP-binding protein [Ferrovibrio sp.]MBX3454639.1 GTP-binding protein [Ferrovibrio sp.]